MQSKHGKDVFAKFGHGILDGLALVVILYGGLLYLVGHTTQCALCLRHLILNLLDLVFYLGEVGEQLRQLLHFLLRQFVDLFTQVLGGCFQLVQR